MSFSENHNLSGRPRKLSNSDGYSEFLFRDTTSPHQSPHLAVSESKKDFVPHNLPIKPFLIKLQTVDGSDEAAQVLRYWHCVEGCGVL